ncbi:SDR family oxidoreductase [Rhodophyticola sp. CCM32]|uniref:SDR family oxidoreductase n=1 Tax=Rhodophyticola sp. CCM32 TaxID=2916397 RepID=UPI00107F51AC|nr:SDR family oxidoreductase [Rhodophyticola sp. CCM32]QBY01302.1 SDR family oxidoreductase [Rhodophyticola sp. CCM32]
MKSLQDLANLSGRKALVTGGAGHIGIAAAEALLELGAEVVLLDLPTSPLEKCAATLRDHHGDRITVLTGDLKDPELPAEIARELQKTSGSLDILINNAAFVGTSDLEGWVTRFEDQSVDTWNQAMQVNLTAAFALIQALVQPLREGGHGSVVNIGSLYGVLGPDLSLYDDTSMGNPAAYAASKGGLLQLTRWLSTVLAPDVRVNAISPGGIFRGQPEVFRDRYVARTPLRRMGKEEDLKGAIAFLASDLSTYVTGQNLMVDGGWSAW